MNGGLSMVEMKSGYKMTEVGVIPEDWGLLPEPFIVGRAWRIWKSIDRSTDAVRWDRAFKKIK